MLQPFLVATLARFVAISLNIPTFVGPLLRSWLYITLIGMEMHYLVSFEMREFECYLFSKWTIPSID